MSFSDELRQAILDASFGGSGNLDVNTFHIGLSRVEPGFDGSANSEPVGNAYARVTFVNSDNNWAAAASGVKQNAAAITFPEASGSWGLVSHLTVWIDPTSDGALSYWASAPLGTSKSIISGDTPNVPVNSLSFTVNSSA